MALEKAIRVAANGPAIINNFNRNSECYRQKSVVEASSWKITLNEIESFRTDVMQYLPANVVDRFIGNVFTKLTDGNMAGDNAEGYVSCRNVIV